METKKLIARGLFFLFTFAVIYFGALIFLCKVNYGPKPIIYYTSDLYTIKGENTYQKFREFNASEKFDVISLGSSHSYRAYDPRIFKEAGYKLFSLGTSSQAPLNTYTIAKNYISKENCRLVLLDVYDGTLNNDGLESASDLIENLPSDNVAFQVAAGYTNPYVVNMLGLRMLTKKDPPLIFDSSYVGNGFSQRKDSLIYSLPFEEYQNKNKPNPTQIKYLDKTLEYLTSNHIPVIVITSPFPHEKKLYQHEIYFKIYYALAKKYHVPYLDYSFNSNFNSMKHFYDSHHLNQTGVSILNRLLLEDLKKYKF